MVPHTSYWEPVLIFWVMLDGCLCICLICPSIFGSRARTNWSQATEVNNLLLPCCNVNAWRECFLLAFFSCLDQDSVVQSLLLPHSTIRINSAALEEDFACACAHFPLNENPNPVWTPARHRPLRENRMTPDSSSGDGVHGPACSGLSPPPPRHLKYHNEEGNMKSTRRLAHWSTGHQAILGAGASFGLLRASI